MSSHPVAPSLDFERYSVINSSLTHPMTRTKWPMNLASRLDFVTLKLFVAIVEEQSFSKAAEREMIAPSAVSKRIADLEGSMRVELLLRQSKLPTAAGKVLLHYARSILLDLSRLEEEVSDHANGTRGLVRIAASESALLRFVPEALRAFAEQHPRVRLDLRTELSSEIVKNVRAGNADLGIFGGSTVADDLQMLPCYVDRLIVLAPLNHPLAQLKATRLSEVLDHEMVEQEPNSIIQSLVERAANELGRPVRSKTRVASYEAACSMALAGFGVAIVPDGFAAKYSASLKAAVIALDEVWAVRQYNLCTRLDADVSITTRLVLNHFRGFLMTTEQHGTLSARPF